MKRLLQTLLATLAIVGLSAAPVAAQTSSCTITNTGPGSVNTCTFDENNSVVITCTNTITVTNVNSQFAQSGSVVISGNTISGTATSGDASNMNNLATDLAQACPAATTASTTPTPTPTTGGQGAVQAATTVKALPKTSAESNIAVLAGIVAILGAVLVGSRALVAFLQRRAN